MDIITTFVILLEQDEINTTTLKSLKAAWIKWAMDNKGFSDATVSLQVYKQVTSVVHEKLTRVDDHFTIQTLSYSFPPEPTPGVITMQLSNDERILNKLFIEECLRMWLEAQREVKQQMLQAVATADRKRLKGSAGGTTKGALDVVRENTEQRVLYSLGIKKLKAWAEDDEDRELKEETAKRLEKIKKDQENHRQFVKRKDT